MTTPRTPPPSRATVEGRAYLDLRSLAKMAGRASDEYLRLYALEGCKVKLAVDAPRDSFSTGRSFIDATLRARRFIASNWSTSRSVPAFTS
ncbi:MAG: hypothetical protein ABIP57_01215 [Jatrophihabitantaceae bacterium]